MDIFSEQQPTPTWQLSIGRNVRPTDITSIPKDLSDHELHDYVHNRCKISLFHLQNSMYTWPTKMSKHTNSPPHMSGQSLTYYNHGDFKTFVLKLQMYFVNLFIGIFGSKERYIHSEVKAFILSYSHLGSIVSNTMEPGLISKTINGEWFIWPIQT